ncbi:MAG: V-type ATPase subunit [Thermoplasmatota archaeon]
MILLELTGTAITVIGGVSAVGITASVFGIRKLVRIGQFSYHNARLSTMGNPYIIRDEVLPLLELKDPSTLIKTIQGDLSFKEEPTSFRESDRQLMHNFHGTLDALYIGSPSGVKPLVKSFIGIWEIDELKRLLRLIGHREEPLYPVGFLDEDLERQFLSARDTAQAIEVLEGTRAGKAIAPLAKEEGVGLDEIDSVLDRFVLDTFMDLDGLDSACRKGAKDFSHILADRYNIHLLVRSKASGLGREEIMPQIYSKGGTIGLPLLEQMAESSNLRETLSVLNGTHLENYFKDGAERGTHAIEIALDRMLLEASVGLSHTHGSTVGPSIRYLIGKEMELKNIRTLLQAVFSGWSQERTKELLILEVTAS